MVAVCGLRGIGNGGIAIRATVLLAGNPDFKSYCVAEGELAGRNGRTDGGDDAGRFVAEN